LSLVVHWRKHPRVAAARVVRVQPVLVPQRLVGLPLAPLPLPLLWLRSL